MNNPLKQSWRYVAILLIAAFGLGLTSAQNNWEEVNTIDVSRDGTYVAIGRRNGMFEVWTRAPMQLIRSFDVFSRGFKSIAWSPIADDIVAFADGFGAVRIMNVTTGIISYEISRVEGVADLAWSPDGARLAGAARFAIAPPEPAVLVWDAITGEVLHRLGRHNEIIQSVDWSPDGGRIISSGADGRIVVWDVATESILHEILFEERNVEEVIWSPDGTKFAARSRGYSGGVNYESDIRIWNASNANLLATFPNSGIFDWDWSPTGQLMAIADNTDTTHTIEIFNVANGQTVSVIQETDNIYRLTWTADGSELVYNAGSEIKSIYTQEDTIIQDVWSVPVGSSGAAALSWSNDSRYLTFSDAFLGTAIELQEDGWYRLDTLERTLSTQSIWPQQPRLSAREAQLLDSGENAFIHVSPNRDYAVFAGQSVGRPTPVIIANWQTEQGVSLPVEALRAGSPDTFMVYWSGDSSAFVLKTTAYLSLSHFHHFVSNISQDLSSITTRQFDSLRVGGRTYAVRDVFDLTHDGGVVLLRVVDIDSRGQGVRLAFWDTQEPETSVILPLDASSALAASFSPKSDDDIHIFNESGVVEFNVQTGVSEVVRSDVTTNSSWVAGAAFSPDGRWLAVETAERVLVLEIAP